ncbi:MAG: triphosphoribosyl-dephospho-CoA synthase [bacterium]
MASLDEILAGRQERKDLIDRLIVPGGCVVSVHANVPGPKKRTSAAHYVVGRFAALFRGGADTVAYGDNADGPFFLARFSDITAKNKKIEAMQAEETTPLGRLVDIDVYDGEGYSLSRKIPRRCYVCDEPAMVCGRLRKHTTIELLAAMDAIVREDACSLAFALIDRAIRTELELDPKFGLVTPMSKGSHHDMDFSLMKAAKDVIVPYLSQMFVLGIEADTEAGVFQAARKIGVAAEQSMLTATGGVNAYKGLIFSLGLAATAAGIISGSGLPFASLFAVVARLAAPLDGELNDEKIQTIGMQAWREHRIGGARREALAGFPAVRQALVWLKAGKQSDLYRTLCGLIGIVEDTVLLKRAGSPKRYEEIRSMFATMSDFSSKTIDEVSWACTKEGLSFGGSADLLVVTVFLKEFQDTFALPL